MRLFGLQITRAKALNTVSNSRGWHPLVHESRAGAWQENVTVDFDTAVSYHAVYACMTLIAQDISKLRVKLVERDSDEIWTETTNPAYSPVLRKPNPYQTRIQFWEHWILSKLMRGNTYVLKERDNRGVVRRLYVLDPSHVRPLVSDDGDVFYQLSQDNLSRLEGPITVPAREIIHDRMNTLFHPLVGVSPLFAAGLAAMQGNRIQNNSTWFFQNRSMPGGILTAPGTIEQPTAERLKTAWEDNYGGENMGRVAVLGDGLEFKPITITAEESQLIEQLKWTAEIICSTFHVPPYKIGIGQLPSHNHIQALNIEYYSQALQALIEGAELALDEGLGMGDNIGTEFDLDGLLRMDAKTQMEVIGLGVDSAIMAPNEGRRKLDLKPVDGGDSPMIQQQNFSLAAIAERDRNKPFSKPDPAAPAAQPVTDEGMSEGEREAAFSFHMHKALIDYAAQGAET